MRTHIASACLDYFVFDAVLALALTVFAAAFFGAAGFLDVVFGFVAVVALATALRALLRFGDVVADASLRGRPTGRLASLAAAFFGVAGFFVAGFFFVAALRFTAEARTTLFTSLPISFPQCLPHSGPAAWGFLAQARQQIE